MIQKIKQWWKSRKLRQEVAEYAKENVYTEQQVEQAFKLGYNDGRRDGLAIARQQATNSLKEILWEQNKKTKR